MASALVVAWDEDKAKEVAVKAALVLGPEDNVYVPVADIKSHIKEVSPVTSTNAPDAVR